MRSSWQECVRNLREKYESNCMTISKGFDRFCGEVLIFQIENEWNLGTVAVSFSNLHSVYLLSFMLSDNKFLKMKLYSHLTVWWMQKMTRAMACTEMWWCSVRNAHKSVSLCQTFNTHSSMKQLKRPKWSIELWSWQPNKSDKEKRCKVCSCDLMFVAFAFQRAQEWFVIGWFEQFFNMVNKLK